jgi:hypothetical protein
VPIFWRTTGLYGGNLSVVWLMLLLAPISMGATVLSHFEIAVADPDLLTKRQEKSQWEESHCGVRNEEVHNSKCTYRVTSFVSSLLIAGEIVIIDIRVNFVPVRNLWAIDKILCGGKKSKIYWNGVRQPVAHVENCDVTVYWLVKTTQSHL